MSTAEINFMEFIQREAPRAPDGSRVGTVHAYSKEVVTAYERAVAERRAQLEASIAFLKARRERVAALRHRVEAFERRFVVLASEAVAPNSDLTGASPLVPAPIGTIEGAAALSLPPRPLPTEVVPAPVVEDLIRRFEHELTQLEGQRAVAVEEAAAAEQELRATALFASPDARHELRGLVEAAAALSRSIDEWGRQSPLRPSGSGPPEPRDRAANGSAEQVEARRVGDEATTSSLSVASGVEPIVERPPAGAGGSTSLPSLDAPPAPIVTDPPSPSMMPSRPVPPQMASLPPPPPINVPSAAPSVSKEPSCGAPVQGAPRTVVDTRRPYTSSDPDGVIATIRQSEPCGGFVSRLPGHLLMLTGAVIVIAALLVLKFG